MSSNNINIFQGYGDKEFLSESEIEEAFNRIKSNYVINFYLSSPGKLILFGEHSVVYGKTAIAASIDRRTYLKLTETKINDSFLINLRAIKFFHLFNYDKLCLFINENIPGNNLESLNKPINDPNYINHDLFNEMLEKNFDKFIAPVKFANEEQKKSLLVFLYLLHGIFYKEYNPDIDSLNQFLSPLAIDISSEIALGAGAGSSASFCVTIAAALLHYKNIKIHGLMSAKEITFSDDVSIFFFNLILFYI